jgi:hypothetical protein
MRLLPATIFLLIVHAACAQLSLVPIPRSTHPAKASAPAARTKATLNLPFWDDFSEGGSAASPERWFAGTSTWVNDGLAINPPSLHVASFDGVDSVGNPYSVNDILAKGFADKLESHPIDLTMVAVAERPTVYMSFYYQMKGRGELPDAGDQLIVEFRNKDNKWEEVWAIENDGTLAVDVFRQVVLPVTADKFFHAQFKFRFKNFARLSGPYDTWHVDYIYLNKGRTPTDTSYPDRSIVSPLTSIFDTYRAIPKTHFFVDKEGFLAKPSIVVHNLRAGDPQPLNYYSYAQVGEYTAGNYTDKPLVLLDSATSIGSVAAFEYKTAEVNTDNLGDLLDEDADSLIVRLKVGLSTKDNVPPAQDGDYDPKFAPMDFRLNDTTASEYRLSSFYAYDDGTAEYGAALNQPGAQVAYEFNLVGAEDGFVNSLHLYFPQFGYGLSQVIELRIWSSLDESSLLYSEVVTLQRTDENEFWIKNLTKTVKVPAKFYVGWKQSSAAIIAIGFDKNTNSGNKIHFNISGSWETNTLLNGSLMIRPVFGEGVDPIDGVEDDYLDVGRMPFPNPSNGTFVIPGHVDNIAVIDLSGRPVHFAAVEGFDETQVAMASASPGIYIVRYLREGRPRVCKLMVR